MGILNGVQQLRNPVSYILMTKLHDGGCAIEVVENAIDYIQETMTHGVDHTIWEVLAWSNFKDDLLELLTSRKQFHCAVVNSYRDNQIKQINTLRWPRSDYKLVEDTIEAYLEFELKREFERIEVKAYDIAHIAEANSPANIVLQINSGGFGRIVYGKPPSSFKDCEVHCFKVPKQECLRAWCAEVWPDIRNIDGDIWPSKTAEAVTRLKRITAAYTVDGDGARLYSYHAGPKREWS